MAYLAMIWQVVNGKKPYRAYSCNVDGPNNPRLIQRHLNALQKAPNNKRVLIYSALRVATNH